MQGGGASGYGYGMMGEGTVKTFYSPHDPKFERAFAQAIRPCWRLRSMTPVANRYLRARDRPMHMQNALVVWAPRTMTRGVAVVRSAVHTAAAQSRTWTTCEGTQPRRLGRRRRRCTYTLGRGNVHFVDAGSVAASKILGNKEENCQRNMKKEWRGK
jgi:hypothetical protein